MIRQLHINNYKSLSDLTLDVERFNVLIGENGCGKSNVLEAIALAAAAVANKLDNEFLASRGIRVTEPQLMRAAFSKEHLDKPIAIQIDYKNFDETIEYSVFNDNKPYSEWSTLIPNLNLKPQEAIQLNRELSDSEQMAATILFKILRESLLRESGNSISDNDTRVAAKIFSYYGSGTIAAIQKIINAPIIQHGENNHGNGSTIEEVTEYFNSVSKNEDQLQDFLIYSPENSALRNFSKEGQIEPLGINGEGLLKLLIVIQDKSPEQFEEIHTCLQLFDWYDGIDIPKDFSHYYEDKVTITDRFLSTTFDQRSANEGFLFVLFYIALMVSDDTPKIFAIDNIDVALNPKLCTKLIKELVRLAKKYDKQVFVTTHNPAILDGIDLGDDEQRLLVLSRNKQGHTRFKRITLQDKPRSSTHEELKLSEAFLRGYLGGLPKGF